MWAWPPHKRKLRVDIEKLRGERAGGIAQPHMEERRWAVAYWGDGGSEVDDTGWAQRAGTREGR